MNKQPIINLIHKKLTGFLSNAEQKTLDDWQQSSDANKQYASELDTIWKASKSYKSSYQPNTDKNLAQLQARISKESQPAKVVSMKRRSPWLLRIAAAVLVLLVAGLYYMNSSSPSTIEVVAHIGESKNVTLPDGSSIILNEGSRLRYPEKFDGNQRKVMLNGEAFFDISHNPEKPFHINTEHTTVTVLGTSFNVRAYNDESQTEVLVKTGKVRLSPSKTDDNIVLTKNHKGFYNHRSQILRKEENRTHNDLAWMNHQLAFQKTPLKFVIQDLERYFNVEIDLQNTQLNNCPYTSLYNQPNLDKILSVLSSAFQIDLTKVGEKQYTLKGGICN